MQALLYGAGHVQCWEGGEPIRVLPSIFQVNGMIREPESCVRFKTTFRLR